MPKRCQLFAAGLVAAALLAACGTSSTPDGPGPEAPPVRVTTSAPTSRVQSPAPTPNPFALAMEHMPRWSPSAPKSTNYGGTVDAAGYAQTIATLTRNVWVAYFAHANLQPPVFSYDITTTADQYVSKCLHDGAPIVVTATYPRPFFCAADGAAQESGVLSDGQVALPLGVITPLWKNFVGHRDAADVAVAIVISRLISHIVINSLQRQLGLTTPPKWRERLAMCLSGTWANAVYPNLKAATTAITGLTRQIPGDEVDGQLMPGDNLPEQRTAWQNGYRSGSPGKCAQQYWS